MRTMPTVINLATPVRSERRRGFQPPWYTVYIYRCPSCGRETAVRAGAFRGIGPNARPEPFVGGIYCHGCDGA